MSVKHFRLTASLKHLKESGSDLLSCGSHRDPTILNTISSIIVPSRETI